MDQELIKHDPDNTQIAYFSMEIAQRPDMPTYSGGLGVLAGDHLRSSADLKVPIVGITLLSSKGYFKQEITPEGIQRERDVDWNPQDFLVPIPIQVEIPVAGRPVQIQSWKNMLKGISGYQVPVYHLDTNLPENESIAREYTDHLYGGDRAYRFAQEMILGIGGVKMLDALGYKNIRCYHLNEGHSALLTLQLAKQTGGFSESNHQHVRTLCHLTTHTPVPAGHDCFDQTLAIKMMDGFMQPEEIKPFCKDGQLNMTLLALQNSHYVNGVSKKHGEVSQNMFPEYAIDSITNGVHHIFWTCPSFQKLYDQYLPGWRKRPFELRHVLRMTDEEIVKAHLEAKKTLIDYINQTSNADMNLNIFTIGFARRMTAYKRPYLLFNDLNRLIKVAENHSSIQIVVAGKAHPQDQAGKDQIKRIVEISKILPPSVKVIFLPGYDINLAKLMTAGVDLWLNTPQVPMEASGTSGMKAALNGVPQLSTLDGWWLEGCVENETGWSIDPILNNPDQSNDELEATKLYCKLDQIILPMYNLHRRSQWVKVMKKAIALNGEHFNSHRMVRDYVTNVYFPD